MSMDQFFYYGLIDLDQEIEIDLAWGLEQPQRSMFYNREYGAGVDGFLGAPAAMITQVLMKYSAEKFIGIRNSRVTAGGNYPERRVGASQGSMSVSVDSDGGVDLQVQYIPLHSYQQRRLTHNAGGLNGA